MQFYVQDNISAALHKLLVLLPVGLGLQIILSFPFNFWWNGLIIDSSRMK